MISFRIKGTFVGADAEFFSLSPVQGIHQCPAEGAAAQRVEFGVGLLVFGFSFGNMKAS